jgi:DNA-directed RNA polymerase subunit RPC12/RpoP
MKHYCMHCLMDTFFSFITETLSGYEVYACDKCGFRIEFRVK